MTSFDNNIKIKLSDNDEIKPKFENMDLNASVNNKLINSNIKQEFENEIKIENEKNCKDQDYDDEDEEDENNSIVSYLNSAVSIAQTDTNTAISDSNDFNNKNSNHHHHIENDMDIDNDTDINSVSVNVDDSEIRDSDDDDEDNDLDIDLDNGIEKDEDEKYIDEILSINKSDDAINTITQKYKKNNNFNSYDKESKDVRGRPSACVFVASLSSNLDDDILCKSVTEHFKQWGEMTLVKVLRDPANRPYAFVQYAKDEDADKAISEGQHSILNGRTVRCEKARVNRTLYLNLTNDGITEKIMNKLLTRFGEIEKLVTLDNNAKVVDDVNPKTHYNTWYCKFKYRQDAISAFANLKTKRNWNVEWSQNIEDEYSNVPEVTIDKYSIFVGHLDPRISKDEMVERFEQHGKIKEAILVNRPLSNFAFIKFKTKEAAAAAVERENHSMFKYKTIHVQYREMYNNYRRKFSNDSGLKLNLAPPPVNFKKRNYGNNNHNSNHNTNTYMNNFKFNNNYNSNYRTRNNSYFEDFSSTVNNSGVETYSQAFKMKNQYIQRDRFNFYNKNRNQNDFTIRRNNGELNYQDNQFNNPFIPTKTPAFENNNMDKAKMNNESKKDDETSTNQSFVDDSMNDSKLDENDESMSIEIIGNDDLNNGEKIQPNKDNIKHDVENDISTMRSNATFSSAGPKTGYTYSSIDNGEVEIPNMHMGPVMNPSYQYPCYYYYPTKDMQYMNPQIPPMIPVDHMNNGNMPPPPPTNGGYYYQYPNYMPPQSNGNGQIYPMYYYYNHPGMEHPGDVPNNPVAPNNTHVQQE